MKKHNKPKALETILTGVFCLCLLFTAVVPAFAAEQHTVTIKPVYYDGSEIPDCDYEPVVINVNDGASYTLTKGDIPDVLTYLAQPTPDQFNPITVTEDTVIEITYLALYFDNIPEMYVGDVSFEVENGSFVGEDPGDGVYAEEIILGEADPVTGIWSYYDDLSFSALGITVPSPGSPDSGYTTGSWDPYEPSGSTVFQVDGEDQCQGMTFTYTFEEENENDPPTSSGDTYTYANESGSWSDDGAVTLTYTVKDSYTVSIPADFITSTSEAAETITASNVMIASGKVLQIKISSANGWQVVDGTDSDNRLAYQIALSAGGEALTDNSVVLSVSAGTHSADDVSTSLYHKITATATKSGTYTDTVTFTVSIGTEIQ